VNQQPGRVRRRPNFVAFLITGGVAGLVVGLILGMVGPADPRYTDTAALGVLGVMFAGLGTLLGGLIAVLVDKRP
jgi:hypothetical protein